MHEFKIFLAGMIFGVILAAVFHYRKTQAMKSIISELQGKATEAEKKLASLISDIRAKANQKQ